MCYDISFTVSLPEIQDYFPELVYDDQMELNFGPVDHIQGVGVFGKHPILYTNRDDSKVHLRMMEWSCIEFHVKKEPEIQKRIGMLNIRSERILDDTASYWYKIRNRRCLVPVTGIFEHREVAGFKNKIPYHVRPKGDSVFFLPGLYSVAEIPDMETGELVSRSTFGIITRSANALMKEIHNHGERKGRMPLFLPLDMGREFLSNELTPERYKEILQYEIEPGDLEFHTTFTIRTMKLRSDGKPKHEPWSWGGDTRIPGFDQDFQD